MNLQRAKEILGENAKQYTDKEILEILDLFEVFGGIIYKEYRKFQIENMKKKSSKKKLLKYLSPL